MRRPRIALLGLLVAAGIAIIPASAQASGLVHHPALRGTPLIKSGIASPSTIRGQVTAAAPVNSTFNFCNFTGPNGTAIACFYAQLHFSNRYQFTLSSVQLSDDACDGRSAMALVHDQQDVYPAGTYGGRLYTYKNSNGCYTTKYFGTGYFEGTSPGVQYVQVALFACNSALANNCSKTVSSLKYYNPYF